MAVIGGYSIDKALNMDYADDEQELRMRLIQSTTVFFLNTQQLWILNTKDSGFSQTKT